MSRTSKEPEERGPQRLQKVLARAGVASRRGSEELIAQGRVTVNGETATLGQKVDPATDSIKLDGRKLTRPALERYLLLCKPRRCLTTVSDPEGRPTVMDLIPPALRRGLHPVGRLDFDTEGLLILSTDGDFSQRVAHPRHGCSKTYEVKVKGEPDPKAIERLRSGIVIFGKRTRPVEIRRIKDKRSGVNSRWSVRLSEGRTRQIREMFQRIGHPVQRLRRVAVGSVRDPRLAPGQFRDLTPDEISSLRDGENPSRHSPAR